MHEVSRTSRAWRFFWAVTAYPKAVLAGGIVLLVAMSAALPRLTRDTSAEAFIPPEHPAVVLRQTIDEIFGLSDPMVVAVVHPGRTGIFNPHSLALVQWLTTHMAAIPGLDADQITSLATENDIIGTAEGMLVQPFFEAPPVSQAGAEAVRQAVMDFPLYLGSLVARDGSATLIVGELLPNAEGEAVYRALLELAARAPVAGEEIHVAGEGAVSGYLEAYITADARQLYPLICLIIIMVLWVAHRTLRGVLIPTLVVIGTAAGTLGSMAAMGVPFYVITNAMPVILIAIGVADSLHILSQYYEEMSLQPEASGRELAVRAMVEMWRPVTFTSLTDMAGFMALALSSPMPPMRAFGFFTTVGVLLALLLSLFVVPALLTLLPPKPSGAFRLAPGAHGHTRADTFGRAMAALGQRVVRRPVWVVVITSGVIVAGGVGALRLEVNDRRMDVFRASEPIALADRVINRRLDGTTYVDIMVEASAPEALFHPPYLRRIEALQAYLETLPHVQGTTSIVDYLKRMHRAVHADRPEAYRLPDDADLVAQYFLLYSISGNPTDLEEEIDYDYRLANVRARMNSGLYSDEKVVMEATQRYLREQFNAPGITAHLSGWANVHYQCIKVLGPSHFRGLVLSLVTVWLMAAVCFRSAVAGFLTVVPISVAVLLLYALMGFVGLGLGVGTAMFAAIAIGTGIDFAVHTIDRLIVLVRQERRALSEAFAVLFPSTGRTLLFNFACVLCGFGVLLSSKVPPLFRFGGLVMATILVSFVGSQTVLPTLVHMLRPRFLDRTRSSTSTLMGLERGSAPRDHHETTTDRREERCNGS